MFYSGEAVSCADFAVDFAMKLKAAKFYSKRSTDFLPFFV